MWDCAQICPTYREWGVKNDRRSSVERHGRAIASSTASHVQPDRAKRGRLHHAPAQRRARVPGGASGQWQTQADLWVHAHNAKSGLMHRAELRERVAGVRPSYLATPMTPQASRADPTREPV